MHHQEDDNLFLSRRQTPALEKADRIIVMQCCPKSDIHHLFYFFFVFHLALRLESFLFPFFPLSRSKFSSGFNFTSVLVLGIDNVFNIVAFCVSLTLNYTKCILLQISGLSSPDIGFI